MKKQDQNELVEQSESLKRSFFETLTDAKRFFREELWDTDVSTLPRIKKLFVSVSRICAIVFRGILYDKCGLQASALTYLTLMSMVPVLALMFSASKGLGAQEMLMGQVGLELVPETGQYQVIPDSWMDQLPEQFETVAQKVLHAVENANIKTLGSIGLAILFWTVIRVMGKIENTFNSIWGIKEPRTIFRRFSDYISILVVVPVLMLCATSVNAFLASDKAVGMAREHLGALASVYEMALNWSVFLAIVLAFTFLFMFMPNTRVKIFPAFLAGIISGVLWLLIQEFYFFAQVGVTKYNPVYGTFAVIPFFLFWLYSSWLTVLFGAEISFAVQNHRTYELEQQAAEATPATRLKLALLITCDITRRHFNGDPAWCVTNFIEGQNVSVRLVREVLHTLTEHDIVRELADDPGCYVPARDSEMISMSDVFEAFQGTPDKAVDYLDVAQTTDIDDRFDAELGSFKDRLQTLNFRQIVRDMKREKNKTTDP